MNGTKRSLYVLMRLLFLNKKIMENKWDNSKWKLMYHPHIGTNIEKLVRITKLYGYE